MRYATYSGVHGNQVADLRIWFRGDDYTEIFNAISWENIGGFVVVNVQDGTRREIPASNVRAIEILREKPLL